MKIVQITSYYPPQHGGAVQRVRDLSERLAKKGHQVEVFTSDIGCPKNKQLKSSKNLKIHYLKSKEFAHTTIIPFLFNKLMKIPKDSIMHVHIGHVLVPEIAWLVSKLRGIPFVAHVRSDTTPSGKLGFLLPLYKRLFLKKVLRGSDKIIVLTRDYKEIISKKYNINLNKIIDIPNATDFNVINDLNHKHKNKNLNLLFVGRLSNEKNVDKIIEAMFRLKSKNINLFLAGDGEDKQKLIDLVKEKRLEKQAIFLGNLDRKRLYKQYLNSNLLLLPSKVECFSSTLIEAMATGTPIIASDIPGTRNIIKNGYNGLLVEPTPEKIAEAIEKLIKNPKLREKLAENGLKEVKKYSWDKIVEQTEEVYKEVLKK